MSMFLLCDNIQSLVLYTTVVSSKQRVDGTVMYVL